MAVYRLFGSELSPYAMQVRSYFRYKRIPYAWSARTPATQAEFDRHARLPLIPLVIGEDGWAMQDSTPIVAHFEALFPTPAIVPEDRVCAFVSVLIGAYADEWVNKTAFHYRWSHPADRAAAAVRLAHESLPRAEKAARTEEAGKIAERMAARLPLLGSTPQTQEPIEGTLVRLLSVLERHLQARPYLFGGRPALADFGLAAQFQQMSEDPTPGALLRRHAPALAAWAERMLDPIGEGPFEPWEAVGGSLRPLIGREIGEIFLPWSTANARALASARTVFALSLDGAPFRQTPQPGHAHALAALKAAYRAAQPNPALERVLAETGCAVWLQAD